MCWLYTTSFPPNDGLYSRLMGRKKGLTGCGCRKEWVLLHTTPLFPVEIFNDGPLFDWSPWQRGEARQNASYESAGRSVNAERVGYGESPSQPISQLFRNQSFCLLQAWQWLILWHAFIELFCALLASLPGAVQFICCTVPAEVKKCYTWLPQDDFKKQNKSLRW